MEEVNFVRLPYLVNHTISAIKNETVILLGRSSSRKHIALLHNKRITSDKWKEVNSYKSPIKRLQDSYQEITGLL